MRVMILGAMLSLAGSNSALAHTGAVPAPAAHVSVSWTWVPGHWTYAKTGVRKNTKCRLHTWVHGYWHHDTHGKSHRTYNAGPPTKRPGAKAQWISGHWTAHNGKRYWIPGHWSRNRIRK